jgi:ParB family chromosome partitioning protein
MTNMKFTQINPEKIDINDKRFQITPFFSVDPLIPSIKRTGLLNPPVLTKREGKYIIVSGWRRIFACRELSIPFIPVFIMLETKDLEAFKVPVFENLSIRDYTQIERAAIVRKLHGFGESPENIIQRYLPLLKAAPRREVMEAYIKIDQLSEEIKETAHNKKWPFGTLEIMTEWTEKERQSLFPLVNELSLNKQKELIENIFEISRKQGVSVQNILSSGEFIKVQKDDSLSPVQKTEKIYLLARTQRYPSLSKWKEALKKISKDMNLPEEIAVIPSKFFEDEVISIRLDVKNKEELEKYVDKLKELSSKKEISLLFNPFSHD